MKAFSWQKSTVWLENDEDSDYLVVLFLQTMFDEKGS